MVKAHFRDGSWVTLRPYGTEFHALVTNVRGTPTAFSLRGRFFRPLMDLTPVHGDVTVFFAQGGWLCPTEATPTHRRVFADAVATSINFGGVEYLPA